MTAIIPLQKELHGYIKINDRNMDHVQDQHIIPILLHEFIRVSSEYPIVFVKNSDTGQFQSVCMLGVKSSENKFVHNQLWVGGYVPLSVRHAPFYLMPDPRNPEQLLIGINEASPRINLENGVSIFTEVGEESEYFTARKNALIDHYEKEQVSQELTQFLAAMNLLIRQEINLSYNSENFNINGVYLIDEERLNSLSDDEFLTVRRKGLLPAIYAQMISIQHLERVANFRAF